MFEFLSLNVSLRYILLSVAKPRSSETHLKRNFDKLLKGILFHIYVKYFVVPLIAALLHYSHAYLSFFVIFLSPFKPEFTIVIFIHYKPRIAVAILDL